MFTGIVEEKGVVVSLLKRRNLVVLTVRAPKTAGGTRPGDSIAVEGVCLTVTKSQGKTLTFDVMKTTIQLTTLKSLQPGDKVNLERALNSTSRFSGHFVTGHVETVGRIREIVRQKNYVEVRISVPHIFFRYIVPKGSISVNGISLTVGDVAKDYFSVHLIPFTLRATTLENIKSKDAVNIETDILAKYIWAMHTRKIK